MWKCGKCTWTKNFIIFSAICYCCCKSCCLWSAFKRSSHWTWKREQIEAREKKFRTKCNELKTKVLILIKSKKVKKHTHKRTRTHKGKLKPKEAYASVLQKLVVGIKSSIFHYCVRICNSTGSNKKVRWMSLRACVWMLFCVLFFVIVVALFFLCMSHFFFSVDALLRDCVLNSYVNETCYSISTCSLSTFESGQVEGKRNKKNNNNKKRKKNRTRRAERHKFS